MRMISKNGWRNYLYLVPILVLSLAFIYYCIGFTVVISFTDWNGISDSWEWVRLDNYKEMLTDSTFWLAVRNNVIFFFGTVFPQALLGFILAVLLKYRFKGSNVYKTIFFLPIALATSITTAIFRIILNPATGDLNNLFRSLGMDWAAQSWLGDKKWALFSIIMVNIFQWMGFSMITYYAALMSLPDDVYESAMLDGAGFWRTTFSITLPMVRGTTNVLIILGIVGSLKTFDLVKLLTNGGPGRATAFLNTYLYEKAFKDFNAGESAAIGVAILIIALIMAVLQVRLSKEED